MASNDLHYTIEEVKAWRQARERAHERVYVAQIGSAASDQSDLDITALIAKLHRWTTELQAELDKRAAFQEHMDEVSADMEESYQEQDREEQMNQTITIGGIVMSYAAAEFVRECGVDVASDLQQLRAGSCDRDTLLSSCLDGAEDDRIAGIRAYVSAVCAAL